MPPEGTTDAATGAIPGAGAMPAQAAQNVNPAGAIPAPGAAGTPPATTTPPTTPPAMGAAELGDAGQRAIAAERTRADEAERRAKAAEEQLTKLTEAGQSDHEKAIAQAKREASVEERTRWQAHIRHTEVRSALRSAGLANDKSLALAATAPEFAKLKVTDEGTVEQVAETVEAFKKDYPEMFGVPATPGPGGPWGGAAGGGGKQQPDTLEGAVMQELNRAK